VEHARGTPRGEDLRRDLDRGYSIPRRSGGGGGGGGGYGGGGGGGGGSRDRFVDFICILSLFVTYFRCYSCGTVPYHIDINC